MITDFKEIQDSALELDEKQRAELAKSLINSLEEDIEQSWIDEIKRRKAEIKSGEVTPISGQKGHKTAREHLKK